MKRNRLHFIAVMTGLVLGLTACGKPSNNQAAAEGQGANDESSRYGNFMEPFSYPTHL